MGAIVLYPPNLFRNAPGLKIGAYLTIRPVALEGEGSNCFAVVSSN